MPSNSYHTPVMVDEVMDFLNCNPNGIYVDATTGGGGHSQSILSILHKQGRLIGLDLDEDALKFSSERLKPFSNYKNFNIGFDQVDFILEDEGVEAIDGILYDLGISSFQIDEDYKGFAFMKDSPLDMRFSKFQKLNAENVVNEYSEEQLFEIFKNYGEERKSKIIASAIVKYREKSHIKNTKQLVGIISEYVPGQYLPKTLARIFQSIRIEVNDEMGRLRKSLNNVFPLIKTGGRIVVISYHSLEDRIVKNFFKEKATGCVCPLEFPICKCNHQPEVKLLTKKIVVPGKKEIKENPRSRSAKLRAVEKI